MADYRPFTIRRTTGGDVLREDDPAAWLAALRWGAIPVDPAVVQAVRVLTRPRYYDGAVLTVQVPADVPWEQAVLVRGGFGAPTTPQDGVVVWYTDVVPEVDGDQVALSQEVLDTPLTPPNWYYYSLFLWISNQWVYAYRAEVLVPANHGWSDLLFGSIPPFYQRVDNEQAADGRTGPLRLFANILGYDLDYTQCWADGVGYVYVVDRCPMKLLVHVGDNFGFPYEAVLGSNRTRSILEQLDDLNGLRGTQLGLENLVTAASDYRCDVVQGFNDLLAVDDGDFDGQGGTPAITPPVPDVEEMRWGIGHWEPLTNATYLASIKDPINSAQNAGGAASVPGILAKNTTPGPGNILTPPGGRGSMVVNAVGPESAVVCGRISTDVPGATLPGCMTTGVPVTPGGLYEYSVETIRTGWGSAPQQPPQARVILGVLWFDVDGQEIQADTGPAVPDNYDITANWKRTVIQVYAPFDDTDPTLNAYYACPVIWWRHASAWAGHATDTTTPPTFGRYVSMVNFGRVRVVGDDVVPVSPDIYLTLGVTSKKLSGPSAHLGEPE